MANLYFLLSYNTGYNYLSDPVNQGDRNHSTIIIKRLGKTYNIKNK